MKMFWRCTDLWYCDGRDLAMAIDELARRLVRHAAGRLS